MSNSKVPQHLAANPFQDLSGVDTTAFSNPYDALLHSTSNSTRLLQERYSTHRSARNTQQKAKLLSPDFDGVIVDPVLQKLEDQSIEPGYVDPRHCLVFWGRPPMRIRRLIGEVQRRLLVAAPGMWVMPLECLHITVLEITHSKTVEEIEILKGQVAPVMEKAVEYAQSNEHRARLIKPCIGFDASALALSFVPADEEADEFSYHHLRRDVFEIVSGAGVKVDSRYVVPSAHLTIGRFITKADFATNDGSLDYAKMKTFVKTIEEINQWLEDELWGNTDGEWTVGEEKGFVLRSGCVWYGGGESMAEGEGFQTKKTVAERPTR